MNRQRKLLGAAGLIGVVATFMPWFGISAGAMGYHFSRHVNGFHGAGIFYFLLTAVIGVLALLGERAKALSKSMRLVVIISGILAVLCLLVAYMQASDDASLGMGMVSLSMGFGYILSFIAAAGALVTPFAIKEVGDSAGLDMSGLKNTFKSFSAGSSAGVPPHEAITQQARMEDMEKITRWKNEGIITDAEYEDLKSKIIR